MQRLAEFIPDLSPKDSAILRALTHFSTWAGRYPDPGSGREKDSQEIFELAEEHKITAYDLFQLGKKIVDYTEQVVKNQESSVKFNL